MIEMPGDSQLETQALQFIECCGQKQMRGARDSAAYDDYIRGEL